VLRLLDEAAAGFPRALRLTKAQDALVTLTRATLDALHARLLALPPMAIDLVVEPVGRMSLARGPVLDTGRRLVVHIPATSFLSAHSGQDLATLPAPRVEGDRSVLTSFVTALGPIGLLLLRAAG
jgi:hypothetical protein